MKSKISPSERRYLGRARVCRVGSIDDDGRPHVAPLCHAIEGNTLYVATDREGRTAHNLRRRPRATIEYDDYYEDWDRIRGVVAHGRARRIEGGKELDRARGVLGKKFRQYRNEELDYIIAVRLEGATSWGL